MLESIVAISMVVVGLLGIITLLMRSSHWHKDVSRELVGTYLAAEGIEVVKHLIDTNITEQLKTGSGTWNDSFTDEFYEVQHNTSLNDLGSRVISDPSNFASLQVLHLEGGRYGYGGVGEVTLFRRFVQISIPPNESADVDVDADRMFVKSVVLWGEEDDEQVQLENVFTFWRKPGGN
ncbi:hypothetical protein CL629_03315 [bacterium]|nr:hypothetical protein [bacterium]